MTRITRPGSPAPLGATWDGSAVNFAIFAERAEKVDLCLFDQATGALETERISLTERTGGVWHVCLPEARPGQLYGYRVHGPHDPARGLRYNRHKLLLDPYARAISGPVEWSQAVFGYPLQGGDDRDLHMNTEDSAPFAPKAVVVDTAFSWGDDVRPNVPWQDTVVYEAHVKGLTQLCPFLPENLRGTYAGLAHPRVIEYLQALGVTSVELLPVHTFLQDQILLDRGLVNYWGYNTLGFFAPERRYSASSDLGAEVSEFKTMVKSLHDAGLEVLLDVVYNHTAEGNHFGPTLSFRGIDNQAYYRLQADNPRYYFDYTGTGNSLNVQHPGTLRLVMDSLRYWVEEMHVDGFRFDLTSTLLRGGHEVDLRGAFLQAVGQDPVVSQVKLIAEPWDLGEGGYQVGAFPPPWSEWNDKYRDVVREYWRGDPGRIAELASRVTGSSEIYSHNGRRPHASINFITAHDGFTLHDLVSYNGKHNEANGEGNRDGTDNNRSWNSGVEGPTDNPRVLQLRAKQMLNMLTTLLISQGVPMLLSGDEVARSQQGNNNTYCQDNELTWHPWELSGGEQQMLDWTRRIIALRKAHPVLRRRVYFEGASGRAERDILWLRPDGGELVGDEWHNPNRRAFGIWLSGCPDGLRDLEGEQVVDDTLFFMLNSGDDNIVFRLPLTPSDTRWELVLDTDKPTSLTRPRLHRGRGRYTVSGRSMVVLKHPTTSKRQDLSAPQLFEEGVSV